MILRKIIATVFILISLGLGIAFYGILEKPDSLEGYFLKSYYGQFVGVALCVELFIGGCYLYMSHKKTNFTLALFGFTAVLDIVYNLIGLTTYGIPTFGVIIIAPCVLGAFWIAFSNAFDLGKIGLKWAVVSFVMGNVVEFFFTNFK